MLRLRSLPLSARFGLSCVLAVVVLGMWASLTHLRNHHAKNDGNPEELSLLDLEGAYHGAEITSPLRAVLSGESRAHPAIDYAEADRLELLTWMNGDRTTEDYDSIDLGDRAPAELLAVHCLSCHGSGVAQSSGGGQALEYWDDVAPLLGETTLTPTPYKIVVTSLHTHAPSMALLILGVCGLALATRFPRGLASLPLFLGGAALLVDTTGWLIAREVKGFSPVIAIAGAVYTGALALAIALVLVELWGPYPAPSNAAEESKSA